MKLVEHFNNLMTETVNLNDTRVTQLEDSIEALKTFLHEAEWTANILSFAAQGSWAHKTIIRPVDGKAFDADLLVFVDPVDGWSPKEYISALRAVFAGSATYKDKIRRYSHCVTIEYAGERNVDIAPCIVNRGGYQRFEVCNFNADEFERSEPEGYTNWLIERNGWTGNNGLRKVTRLLKYLRDIKGTFSCKSVLLTTLLGGRITVLDNFNETNFADLPTALKIIVGRLDDWLQGRAQKPAVANPVLPSEVLSTVWEDGQYENFREQIHTYRGWIDDAYEEPDRDESIGKWQRVFGEEFAKNAALEKAAAVSKDARALLESTSLVRAGTFDLVSLFARFGRSILPSYFDRLPHKQRPKWKNVPNRLFTVTVTATRHASRNGTWIDSPEGGAGPLPKGQWLKFSAYSGAGQPIGSDYEIHWRVTNTDEEARRANQLRGGFEPCNDGRSRWESLKYRGVHSIEAFIVRKRDKTLVSFSDPFYVVID